jgi:hypothetical protein
VRSSSSLKSLQQTPSRGSRLLQLAGSGGVSVPLAFKGRTGGLVSMFPSLFGKETATVPFGLDSEAILKDEIARLFFARLVYSETSGVDLK